MNFAKGPLYIAGCKKGTCLRLMKAVLILYRFRRTDDLGAALHAHSDQQPIRYASS